MTEERYNMLPVARWNEKTQTLERAIMVLTDDEKRAINMIRISLSHLNTKEEIDILIEKLKEIERI